MTEKEATTQHSRAMNILKSHNNTPNGCIRDADTILEDIMDERETEVSGTGAEILELYLNAKNRNDFCKLFEAMTGCTFDEYLTRCEEVLQEPQSKRVYYILMDGSELATTMTIHPNEGGRVTAEPIIAHNSDILFGVRMDCGLYMYNPNSAMVYPVKTTTRPYVVPFVTLTPEQKARLDEAIARNLLITADNDDSSTPKSLDETGAVEMEMQLSTFNVTIKTDDEIRTVRVNAHSPSIARVKAVVGSTARVISCTPEGTMNRYTFEIDVEIPFAHTTYHDTVTVMASTYQSASSQAYALIKAKLNAIDWKVTSVVDDMGNQLI